MPAGTILVLEFADVVGNSIFFSYNYGNDEALVSDIRTAMNTIIANGSIFPNPPVSIKSAKTVVITESDFDLSD